MQLSINDFLNLIAVSGLVLFLSGEVLAQQPNQTPPQNVAAKTRETTSERPPNSEVSERERLLLERIERLERRVNELESRAGSTATNIEGNIAPTVITQQSASATAQNAATQQQNPYPPTAGAAPQQATQTSQASHQNKKPASIPQYAAWDKDGVKIIPYGILNVNVDYNTSALDPGSFSAFALPKLLPDQKQFHISPGNTYLGVDIKWPKIGDWEINGKVDLNLRGVAPLKADNIFQPQFINIYGEARTERYRILAGQTLDVVAPFFPNSLNSYPISYMPGSLGYFRPQVRFETYQPIGGDYTFIFQGAASQAIQTLNVGAEVFGTQKGLPDGQARIALGYGKPVLKGLLPKRTFELGISSHIGQRRGATMTVPIIERDFTSWSGSVDLSFKIGSRLRFEGEFFSGSVLGDYAGAIFETFNPIRGVAIRASGGWAQLTYDINDKWQVNGAYGKDDPYNRDIAIGQRSLNDMGFVNTFYRITPRLWVALEFSHWRTRWVGLPRGSAFRVEPAVLFFF